MSHLYGLGVADIRIIVHQGNPSMAMLRLPTRNSGGKANLHQGGIGVGVDIATGETIHAIDSYKSIENHLKPLTEIIIDWYKHPKHFCLIFY